MLKIKIVAVGNIKEDYFIDAAKEYCKRLSKFCEIEVVEVKEFAGQSKSSVAQVMEYECEGIKKYLAGYVVALDKSGKQLDSEDFAKLIDKVGVGGQSKLTFVIGGSHGLTDEIKNLANMVMSFGKLTYPHQLMRVVLLEQIYRAETILNNITYHK